MSQGEKGEPGLGPGDRVSCEAASHGAEGAGVTTRERTWGVMVWEVGEVLHV